MVGAWLGNGYLRTYQATPTGGTLEYGSTVLAFPGVFDVNHVTRIQYPIVVGKLPVSLSLASKATFRVTRDEWLAAQAEGLDITMRMYVAPASGWIGGGGGDDMKYGLQLTAHSVGFVTFGTKWVSDDPPPANAGYKDYEFSAFAPLTGSWWGSGNTKLWVGLALTYAKKTDDPKNFGTIYEDLRGVSLWTNRRPAPPTIASPASGLTIAGGNSFNLSIVSNDPDRVTGGTTGQYTDVAGLHVQYAPRPTAANPSPAWADLPFADSSGVLRKGWWIDSNTANTAGEAMETLVNTGTIPVLCGSNTPIAGRGLLPAGEWQIRVRAFDYGHPLPGFFPPLGDPAKTGVTPSTYPASNASGWSDPVIVSIGAQVPPPLPLFPMNNLAITSDAAVTLQWQYRNTANPPFPQAQWWVQYRVVGDPTWIDYAYDSTADTHTDFFEVIPETQFEWRVRVADSDGVESNWSEPARFWGVHPPGVSGNRPLPTETIEGATLGCGTHRAMIYRRGGKTPVGEITGITSLDWERVRDDISTAKVVVEDWGVDCGNLLASLHPWAHELVILRDNGYTVDRVWEGPITLLTYKTDSVTIHAKDMMGYAYRRIIKQAVNDTGSSPTRGDSVVQRAVRVLQNAFAPDDPNILQHLVAISHDDDAGQYRSIPAYSRTAFEEVDDMAANAGLDYTTVGRRIIVWGTKHRIGTLPEFRDADLGSPPIVSVYGMSFANRYAISDGNGVWGEATRLDANGEDDVHGLVEILSTSWASDSADETGTYTAEDLAKKQASFAEFAERAISDRNPPPVVVRVPDNTTLHPGAVISIQHLVPGVVVPLRSTGTLKAVVASQKLDSVKVTETDGKETITISLSPFNRDDGAAGEEGGEE